MQLWRGTNRVCCYGPTPLGHASHEMQYGTFFPFATIKLFNMGMLSLSQAHEPTSFEPVPTLVTLCVLVERRG
jgi:hypothetical protein